MTMSSDVVVSVEDAPSYRADGAASTVESVASLFEAQIPRDQWGRPKIIQPDGSLKAYRRASSVAEVIEDHYGLNMWKLRLAIQGLAQRPDLLQAVHIAKKPGEISGIAEEAQEQAGAHVASRNGQTVHGLTENMHDGEAPPQGLTAGITAMLTEYAEAMQRFEVLDTERFVVQDKICVAGTYDLMLKDTVTGKVLVGDLKTGKQAKYLTTKTPAQVAVYAAGQHYSLDGKREPHCADVNWGVLVHLPWTEDPEAAKCELRWLDLRQGRRNIREAFRVEKIRKMKVNDVMPRMD